MSRYGSKRYTLLPSVYGDSNFRFLNQTFSNPITIIVSQNDVRRVACLYKVYGCKKRTTESPCICPCFQRLRT